MVFLAIAIVIFVILFIGGGIVLLYYLMTKGRTNVPPIKSSLYWNFKASDFGGYAMFIETNTIPSQYNPDQIYIEGIPLDVKNDKEGKPIIPKIQNMSVKRNMIIPFSPLTLSAYRQINIVLCKPEDMHPDVRNSKLGLALSLVYDINAKEDMIIESVRNRTKQITDVVRESYSGELFADIINNVKNMLQDSTTKRLGQEGFKIPREHNWEKEEKR